MSHGDIIQFYNQAFMPPLKKILVQLNRQIEKHEVAPQSPTKADAIGITPPLAAQRSPGVSFRKEENVYVQRLKNKVRSGVNETCFLSYTSAAVVVALLHTLVDLRWYAQVMS